MGKPSVRNQQAGKNIFKNKDPAIRGINFFGSV